MGSDIQLEIDDDAPEALLEYFTAQGWGDGLPLVAATPERVDAMSRAGAGDRGPMSCPAAGQARRAARRCARVPAAPHYAAAHAPRWPIQT